MKRLVVILVLLSISTSLKAQTIHGSFQKTSYNNPTEWITIPDDQVHWDAIGVNGMFPGMPGHTHLQCAFPLYAELRLNPFTIPCMFILYHTSGYIGPSPKDATFFYGPSIASFTADNESHFDSIWGNAVAGWQAATTDAFPLVGDPNGITAIKVNVTINPSLHINDCCPSAPHGWGFFTLNLVTRFANSDINTNILHLPFFSVADPTAPDTGIAGPYFLSGSFLGSSQAPFGYGFEYLQTGQMLPLAGLQTIAADNPFSFSFVGYSYAASDTVTGFFRVLEDANFHQNIPGNEIPCSLGHTDGGSLICTFSYPTSSTTVRKHTLFVQWITPAPDGSNVVLSTNSKFTVDVVASGTVLPPPPPPPPPVSTQSWQVISSTVQRLFDSVLGALNELRVCTSDGFCVAIP